MNELFKGSFDNGPNKALDKFKDDMYTALVMAKQLVKNDKLSTSKGRLIFQKINV